MAAEGSMVRVLIATTAGPIDIDGIIDTPVIHQSIVEIPRPENITRTPQTKAEDEALQELSSRYNKFTSCAGGVIGSLYKNEYFRLSLSKLIDEGISWQLPVFIAHALHAAGRLAHKDQIADTVVFATGKVNGRLSVEGVKSLPDKVTYAVKMGNQAGRLLKEAEQGHEILMIWPRENHNEVEQWREQLEKIPRTRILPIEEVALALKALDLELPAYAATVSWTDSPFRGLEPFTEEHRDIFFGRGRAREEALDLLRGAAARGTAFLLIHGSSGAGKSSLVRAGLLGDLQELAREADEWPAGILVPGRSGSPIAALAQAMVEGVPELDYTPDQLAKLILARPAEVISAIGNALGKDGRRRKLVLVVDQLEELFLWTREQRSAEAIQAQQDFAVMLERLSGSGSVWVIATMRSDLQSLLDDRPELARLASTRSYRLERPNHWALREIVEQPAKIANLRFKDEDAVRAKGMPLVELLVEAAAKSAGSLPLLEFALSRLYDQRSPDGTIDYAAYERIDRLEGAISLWTDDVVRALNNDIAVRAIGSKAETERAVDDVILALARVEPGSDAGPGRNIVARTAKLDDLVTPMHEAVIAALRKARLIVPETIDGQRTIRVAHEALLSHWDHAKTLLNAHKDALELRDRLEADALGWNDQPHNDLLIFGLRLAAAEKLVRTRKVSLSATARSFVDKSREWASTNEVVEREWLRRAGTRERVIRELKKGAETALKAFGLVALAGILLGGALVLYVGDRRAYDVIFDQVVERSWLDAVYRQRDELVIEYARYLNGLSRQSLVRGDAVMAMLFALEAQDPGCSEPLFVAGHRSCISFLAEVKPSMPTLDLLRRGIEQYTGKPVEDPAAATQDPDHSRLNERPVQSPSDGASVEDILKSLPVISEQWTVVLAPGPEQNDSTRKDVKDQTAAKQDIPLVPHRSREEIGEYADALVRMALVGAWSGAPRKKSLVELARELVPRCLTGEEREDAGLQRTPPDWCIDMRKAPYNTAEWQKQLANRRAEENHEYCRRQSRGHLLSSPDRIKCDRYSPL
jgi:hypothetical protein